MQDLAMSTCLRRGLVWLMMWVTCFAVTATSSIVEAGTPVFAQIKNAPNTAGSAPRGGVDPTFQRAAMIAACVVGVFLLSLLCYLVLFRVFLNSWWPRTAYAATSALFWVLSTALVLSMFWQSLKFRFTATEAWYNEHGVRALVILQGVVIAAILLFSLRSQGPFPVLQRARKTKQG